MTSRAAWPACDVPGSHVTIVWPQRHAGNGKLRGLVTGDQLDCRLLVTDAGSPACVWFATRLEQGGSPLWLWPRLVLIGREWKYSKETLIVHALTQNSWPDIKSYHQDALGLGEGMWCLEVTSVLSLLILFIRAKLCWLGVRTRFPTTMWRSRSAAVLRCPQPYLCTIVRNISFCKLCRALASLHLTRPPTGARDK